MALRVLWNGGDLRNPGAGIQFGLREAEKSGRARTPGAPTAQNQPIVLVRKDF